MAVPNTIDRWRDFVSRSPESDKPTLRTPEELARMSAEAKEHHDGQRAAWFGSDFVLRTSDVDLLSKWERRAALLGTAQSATATRGIAVSGRSTLGKSTAVLAVGRQHELRCRRRQPDHDSDYAPVVYVVVPAGTTPKALMVAFSHFLNLPVPTRGNTQALTETVISVLSDLRTSMVILDEVHNLRTSHVAGAEAASSLKTFSERIDATFVYTGIDLPSTDLFTGDMGRQIKGRVSMHHMRPYGYGTQQQRAEWGELVEALEHDWLILSKHKPGTLSEEATATYLFDRTAGSIGSLRALLADAAATAILDGTERITREILDQTPTDQLATEEFDTLPATGNARQRGATKQRRAR